METVFLPNCCHPSTGPCSHNPDNHNINITTVKTSKSCILYTVDTKCHKIPGSNYDENTGRWTNIFALSGPFTKFYPDLCYVNICDICSLMSWSLHNLWHTIYRLAWSPLYLLQFNNLHCNWYQKKVKLHEDEIHTCHYRTVCHIITNLRLSPSHAMTQAVTSLWQWGPEFNPRPVRAGLFMDKVQREQIFLTVFYFYSQYHSINAPHSLYFTV